ncbi:MAG: GTPase Era [Rikenellaceae bacterium]|nr:GTPase Era [Rikenellaceae bacterium]MBR2443353.1 GTPase Era [Rikenellaceae bacterium]
MHKSGFVNIIGNPNVGKSTLMNALVGERMSIITSKAQTTRHRIVGIVNTEEYQIVFSDTPGILRPSYKLQESMMRSVNGAVADADVILYVTDVVEQRAVRDDNPMERSAEVLAKVAKAKVPTIVLINKIDLSTPDELEGMVARWKTLLPDAVVLPISAKNAFGTEALMSMIVERLPEGEPYYDKDALTDRPMRFFASEIIREKILLNYTKEVPYSVEVAIDAYRESPEIDRISATIYVARASQKGIIIGRGGAMLKKVGTEARKDLERFLDKKVFLELFVKVDEGWRDDSRQLRRFGYEDFE